MSKAPPPVVAGKHRLEFDARTLVMGIVNVTPDSFSGDGLSGDAAAAADRALQLVREGADIVDIGGESTRPNAADVPADEELSRTIPVIEALREQIGVPISIDTRKAAVARAAISAGASIVNDVWGLRRDTDMAAAIAAQPDVAVVVMHNQQGTSYTDLMEDIAAGLRESLALARAAGISEDRVIVDPGFGFGKTPAQNIELMRRLPEIRALGRPILIGVSRKSTIGFLTGDEDPQRRVEGGIALAALAAAAGVSIIRTHDVAQTVRALQVADAVVHDTPERIRDLPAPGQTG